MREEKERKMHITLWPSRKQWRDWSLPSKLTAIGSYVGIIMFVLYLFSLFVTVFRSPLVDISLAIPRGKYFLKANEKQIISLDVILSTSANIVLKDCSIDASFYKYDVEKREYVKIPAEDIVDHVTIDRESIICSPLNQISSKQRIDFGVTCHKVGEYLVKLSIASREMKLRKEAAFVLVVRTFKASDFSYARLGKVPTFTIDYEAGDQIVNIYPESFYDFEEFKIMLVDEADDTNFLKSTIWFKRHLKQVGADSSYFILYMHTGSMFDYSGNGSDFHLVKDVCLSDSRDLFKIGKLLGSLVVPVGSCLYRVKEIDSSRVAFERIADDQYRQLRVQTVEKTKKENEYYKKYVINERNLTIESTFSCGATGRHCELSLEINEKRYADHESSEIASWSDFPVFLPLRVEHGLTFLRIDPYGNVEDSEIKVDEFVDLASHGND